ncbi:hypothetical protein CPB86DRAFT_293734 [Serendipita vermifera]|nr:hypothetical protein CPB86DRAFT_293734 [Serendipita vermifera]
MSHWPTARHSSGVEPFGSQTNLPDHAARFGRDDGSTFIDHSEKVTPAPQPPKPPFYKRRGFIICQIVTAIIGIAMIFILLWPVVHAIAQHVLDVSHMTVTSSVIESPSNDTFTLKMEGYVTNTGIIPATIHWTEPVRVSWMRDYGQDNETEIPIGNMWLDSLVAKNKRATINQTTQFNISDEQAFGEFTQTMITKPDFTWRLASDFVKVNALKFPQATKLRFRKDLTLKGINSFNGSVVLKDFSLPGEDPNGGIKFSTTTTLTNESPFTVDLGNIAFNLKYEGVSLGQGTSRGVVIRPGPNDVTLTGTMAPHTSASDLDKIGKLFTAYLNGDASPVTAEGVSTTQTSGQHISWLSDGITALTLQVPLKSPNPINAIQGIQIGYLNLTFTENTVWSPMTSTDDLHAQLALPFGFGMDVSQIGNSFSIYRDGRNISSLSSPLSEATSDIRTISTSMTRGNIDITLAESPLVVPNDAHDQFAAFNKDLTQGSNITFRLIGKAKTVATLPIGKITLDPVKFNVTSSLAGLKGLQDAVKITAVDVMGGTSDYMELAITTTINNPSGLNLQAGDLTLQLFSNGALLGTATMPNLHLVRGDNTIAATSQFKPNDTPEGTETLRRFLAAENTVLQIKGYDGSTTYASLLPAFRSMDVQSELPGLQTKLLNSAKLTVLPTTGRENNIAHTQVALNDPFTSGFTVVTVKSTVDYSGMTLGKIEQDTNFQCAGKATTTSPDLNFDMNLDPSTMFTVLRKLAVEAGLDTAQIDGIVELGGYQYVQPVARRDLERRGIFSGFNLPSFVDQAFAVLKADITLESQVLIGDYRTTLNYIQKGVQVQTDETLHLILSVLAQPIVQKIVDGSVMGIDTLIISNPKEQSFDTALKGSITQAGPFDATISFPSGLDIYWNNQKMGSLAMPDVQLAADVGATLDNSAPFAVADVGVLTAFTKVMLQEASFEWEIRGQNLTVTAMGVPVSGISLTKKVTLKGMSGLQGAVTINSFDLPGDDPAGGITLTLATSIVNPSQVGISLNSLAFSSYYSTGTYLGPVASVPTLTLAPLSTSQVNFAGRLVPQTTEAGLADVSKIFTDFIHDKPSGVIVQGESADPNVSWLTEGIKTLRISSVLPSRGVLSIIQTITINQMTMDFPAGSAYAPISSSSDTAVAFQLPFGFALNIVELKQTIYAKYQGSQFAQLALGTVPAQTDTAARIIHLSFSNIPFQVTSGQEGTFQQFLAQTTTTDSVTFGLAGNADSVAETSIGRLTISDIAFDVPSVLKGINTFGGTAQISDVHIAGGGGEGGSQYLSSPLKTGLNNPSEITLKAGSISLPTYFQDVQVGTSVVPTFNLVPGANSLDAEFRYQPADANDTVAQSFLQAYLEQGGSVPVTIRGDSHSSEYDSLVPALEQTTLSSGVPGIAAKLVTHINVYLSLSGAVLTGEVEVDFDVYNPLDCELQILHVQNDSLYQGEVYAQFTFDWPSFVIPPKATVNSGRIPHVKLVKGVAGSLVLLGATSLDIRIAQTGIIGTNGYHVPWLKYNQDGVPMTLVPGL